MCKSGPRRFAALNRVLVDLANVQGRCSRCQESKKLRVGSVTQHFDKRPLKTASPFVRQVWHARALQSRARSRKLLESPLRSSMLCCSLSQVYCCTFVANAVLRTRDSRALELLISQLSVQKPDLNASVRLAIALRPICTRRVGCRMPAPAHRPRVSGSAGVSSAPRQHRVLDNDC